MSLKRTAVLICVAVLAVSGCGREQSSTKRLAFITNNAADFWTIARKGTEKADAELPDVTVEFRLGDGTAAAQKRIVDDLLAKGVDGIAISPVDPANQTAMLNDAAKQALVFTHDSDAPDSKRECYVGTDNVAAGRQAGDLIKEALPQGGKIAVFVGKLDARNAQERLQGIKEAIAGANDRHHRRAHRRHRSGPREGQRLRDARQPSRRRRARRLVELQRAGDPQRRAGRRQDRPGEDHRVRRRRRDADRRQVGRDRRHGGAAAVSSSATSRSPCWRRRSRAIDPASRPSRQLFIPTSVIRQNNVDEFRTTLTQLRGR